MRIVFTFFLSVLLFTLSAQVETLRTVSIVGKVSDAFNDEAIEFATVYIQGTSNAVETDVNGEFELKGPTGQGFMVVFTRIGYKEATANVPAMKAGTVRRINVSLASMTSDLEVIVTESRIEDQGMVREEVTELKLLPTTTGNLESVWWRTKFAIQWAWWKLR